LAGLCFSSKANRPELPVADHQCPTYVMQQAQLQPMPFYYNAFRIVELMIFLADFAAGRSNNCSQSQEYINRLMEYE